MVGDFPFWAIFGLNLSTMYHKFEFLQSSDLDCLMLYIYNYNQSLDILYDPWTSLWCENNGRHGDKTDTRWTSYQMMTAFHQILKWKKHTSSTEPYWESVLQSWTELATRKWNTVREKRTLPSCILLLSMFTISTLTFFVTALMSHFTSSQNLEPTLNKFFFALWSMG